MLINYINEISHIIDSIASMSPRHVTNVYIHMHVNIYCRLTMQRDDRCLVKNLTTGRDLIVYAHNVYRKNSDGIIHVATEEDITSSDVSLFIRSDGVQVPITMIIYKRK